mmetsp:Transcript_25176/g.24630  ORF Transcript_25176/g.24630 Transcript_25176/m.24630 type:complete len:125 (+) Transcript_25176:47-421(+)
MPFLKGLIISELQDDVEIYKYIAKDLKFKNEVTENFLNGLRGGMNELYTDFKSQLTKLGSCQTFQVSVMYDQYFVRKLQIGTHILLIVICENSNLDLGALDLLCQDFKTNFSKVDQFIDQVNKV